MSDLERFLEGLNRREEAFRRMAVASREQAAALAGGDVEVLLALAARKGALLREIEEVERDLAPWRNRWPEWKRRLDPDARRRVEEAVERTRGVLEELIRMEEEGRKLLEGVGRGEAGPVVSWRRARTAYGGPPREEAG